MNLGDFSDDLARIVSHAAPSVVTVYGTRPISGVVPADGQVLTVAHLMAGDEVETADGRGGRQVAQVVGSDPVSDLALLAVPGLRAEPFQSAPARLGEWTLAVARPQPTRPQVSGGMMADVSDLAGDTETWWRTDARPAPGFSGGLLVNAHGAWLGLLHAGRVRGSLSVLPLGRALEVAELLARQGRVPRGHLGVRSQGVYFDDGHRQRLGLMVLATEAGSPAAAGLQAGDVLTALDGHPLESVEALLGAVRSRSGEEVHLSFLRGGQEQSCRLTIAER